MSPPKNYAAVHSLDELQALVDKLMAHDGPIGYDIETGYDGPDRKKGALAISWQHQFTVGVSLSADPSWARYIPLRHDLSANLPEEAAWAILKPLLETKKIVAHNAKFEKRNARKYGIELNVHADTMIQAYVLSEWKGFGLKDMVRDLFGHEMAHIEDLFPNATQKQMAALRFNVLDTSPEVVSYACEDAAWCLAVHDKLEKRALAERNFIYRTEMAIVNLMTDVEDWGVAADWEGMRLARARAEVFLPRLEAAVKSELSKMAGRSLATLNLGSPMQLKKLLYGPPEEGGLGLSTTRLTKKGELSTDAIALEGLAQTTSAVWLLLRLREAENLKNRFALWLEEEASGLVIQGSDSRVHASYGQVIVGTGRFAANDPPIQQCPKDWRFVADAAFGDPFKKENWARIQEEANPKDVWSGNFREYIIAAPGSYLLTFDYSQIELRIMAGLSGEPSLIRAFQEDQDVHTLTAAMMLRKPVESIDPKTERPVGKAQSVDSRVLTPIGWRRFGDLVPGDELIGSDGLPTRVTGVFPQGIRPVYRVVTSDGATTECCEEHLWAVRNKNSKDAKWQTRTLRYLMDHGIRQEQGKYAQPKYELPARPVVQFDPRPALKVDPYVLGLLLGDGGFTHSWGPSFSSEDPELLIAVAQEHERLGGVVAGHFLRPGPKPHPGFYLSGDKYKRGSNVIKDTLRSYGLWGKKGHLKCVPEDYMLASPEDRLALLQGLLDTDGNVVMGTSAQFRVTSEKLALAAQELARSLGGWASIIEFQPEVGTGYGASRRPMWNVHLSLPNGMNPFRLERKASQIRERRRSISQRILRVEGGDAREVQCVSVSSPDGLYVTDDYIVTHNTMNFARQPFYTEWVQSLSLSV